MCSWLALLDSIRITNQFLLFVTNFLLCLTFSSYYMFSLLVLPSAIRYSIHFCLYLSLRLRFQLFILNDFLLPLSLGSLSSTGFGYYFSLVLQPQLFVIVHIFLFPFLHFPSAVHNLIFLCLTFLHFLYQWPLSTSFDLTV